MTTATIVLAFNFDTRAVDQRGFLELPLRILLRDLIDKVNANSVTLDSDITGKQDADATLTALAGLATAADKGVYFTAADVAAAFDLTAAGRALLDDATAADQRTTMGVAIGSDVQAYDANNAVGGSTGGTGSAGAGNQYIEITVAGTTYKCLHDGTV